MRRSFNAGGMRYLSGYLKNRALGNTGLGIVRSLGHGVVRDQRLCHPGRCRYGKQDDHDRQHRGPPEAGRERPREQAERSIVLHTGQKPRAADTYRACRTVSATNSTVTMR